MVENHKRAGFFLLFRTEIPKENHNHFKDYIEHPPEEKEKNISTLIFIKVHNSYKKFTL